MKIEVDQLGDLAWNYGACKMALRCSKEKGKDKISLYNPKKTECDNLKREMNTLFSEMANKYPHQKKSLKELSMFAKNGGRTARLDVELREHGFDHDDICASPNAYQMYNALVEMKQKFY